MEIAKGRMIVRAKLEGKRFFTFQNALIDTGATYVTIPPEIADLLDLEPYELSPTTLIYTVSGLIPAPMKVLEAIEIGEIRKEKLPVVVQRIPIGPPFRFLLGMNLIQEAKLEVNGKGKTWAITDP